MTLEEWADLPDDEPGELVDGHIEEEEDAGLEHALAVTWLSCVLFGWARRRGLVFGSGMKYAVGPNRGRKADVTVYLEADGSRLPRYGAVRVPPDTRS